LEEQCIPHLLQTARTRNGYCWNRSCLSRPLEGPSRNGQTWNNSGNDRRDGFENCPDIDVFSVDCSVLVEEIRKQRGLKTFARIAEVPSADNIYRFMSRFDEGWFVSLVSGVHNSLGSPTGRRKSGTILIDSTAITLDLNWFRRTFTKAQLHSWDFDWGYSHVHGHYIGYKLDSDRRLSV
jgi:hypothetical protein